MFIAWVVFHVIVCAGLVVVVLMQSSKGEGLAGTSFAGGVSGAVFGGRGAASFLSKATTVLAILFMFNCAALAYMSAKADNVDTTGATTGGESVVTRQAQLEREQAAQRQQQQQAEQNAASQADSLINLMNEPPAESSDQPGGNDQGGETGSDGDQSSP